MIRVRAIAAGSTIVSERAHPLESTIVAGRVRQPKLKRGTTSRERALSSESANNDERAHRVEENQWR
jgi:hypothetical protein